MPGTLENRIGFGINFADMIHHYAPIWKILGSEKVGVVPFGTLDEQREIRSAARDLGCEIFESDDLIANGSRFDVFISHQYLSMFEDLPIFKKLGRYNLRFMYTLAQDGWNFADWNVHYDGFLCYGPYQANRFAAQFPGKVAIQMGYPRFDGFFKGEIATGKILSELSCDPIRPTLVWLPAYGVFSSVDRYCDAIAALRERFNIVVKPHPYTTTGELPRMERLKSAGFTAVIDGLYDNLNLLAIADWVVCDYGGPIFGALYTDRNLLLLDLPGASDHALVGPDSPEIRVRRQIVSTDTANAAAIAALLDDEAIWKRQAKGRQALRQEFFAPFYGFSAQVAALLLTNASELVHPEGSLNGKVTSSC